MTAGANGYLRLWDARSGRCVRCGDEALEFVPTSLLAMPDRRFVLASGDALFRKHPQTRTHRHRHRPQTQTQTQHTHTRAQFFTPLCMRRLLVQPLGCSMRAVSSRSSSQTGSPARSPAAATHRRARANPRGNRQSKLQALVRSRASLWQYTDRHKPVSFFSSFVPAIAVGLRWALS